MTIRDYNRLNEIIEGIEVNGNFWYIEDDTADDTMNYDFITDRIATGGICYRRGHMGGLDRVGFTVVVDCQREADYTELFAEEAPHLAYLKNGVADDGRRKSVEWFRRTADWIAPKLEDPDNKFLIHCGAGINRGPSMAYFVLRMTGMSEDDAYEAIVTNRRIIQRWGWGMAYVNDADRAIRALGLGAVA